MSKPSKTLLALANNCGINGKGKTVQQIQAEHEASRSKQFADQFDMMLEEQLKRELKA